MDHPLPDLPASDHDPAPADAALIASVTDVRTPPAASAPVDDPVAVEVDGPVAATEDGPGDDESVATPRSGWRSPWAIGAALGLVIVIITAVALVSTVRSTDRARGDLADATAAGAETQADLDQADRDLQAQRAQLATVLGQATAVGDQLAADTAKRDDQTSAVDQARSDLTTLNGLLNSQKANIFAQATLMTQLSDCINSANVALNLMSFGDREKGTTLLQDSSQKCDAVNDYLAGRGVTK